ncbi:etoposide-induced protein 2.4 homolog [Anthonomus grandis grandis]|uniref:etoposide-induced protein 2.4 homolog n=1 Tax=Anthonomus grandis grandis TaxID=2921223 RepID=UPI00216624F8|nr:etoposide-induced protein 2.4 homolog [Anthonomus grandis grandis]
MELKNILSAIIKGVYDSFRGMVVIFYLDKEINDSVRTRHSPAIRQKDSESKTHLSNRQGKQERSKVGRNVLQCALLNGGVFLLSVLIFEHLLLPTIDALIEMIFGDSSFVTVWFWVKHFILMVYRSAWLVPLFLLSKVINALWFQDIADSAYRHSRGRPVSFPSISMFFADSFFSIVVQCLFLIQATLTSYIPINPLGYILYITQVSLLYSLYSFEYKWFNMGWELHKRLSFIEENWPYFLGFGLPLTILTQLSDSWVISGCVFSILFPLFIISGNEATPVTGVTNLHLQLFTLVIGTGNTLFSRTIGKSKKVPQTPVTVTQNRVR